MSKTTQATPEVAPDAAPAVVDVFADLKAQAAAANAKQVMVVEPANPKAKPALRVDH